jgi:hypothetical protein
MIKKAVKLLEKAVEETDQFEVQVMVARAYFNEAVARIKDAIRELESCGAEFPKDADGNPF